MWSILRVQTPRLLFIYTLVFLDHLNWSKLDSFIEIHTSTLLGIIYFSFVFTWKVIIKVNYDRYTGTSIMAKTILELQNTANLEIYLSRIKHACCSIYFTTFRLRSCHECLCSIPWKLLSIRIFIDQRRTMTSPISSKLLWVFKFPPILFI